MSLTLGLSGQPYSGPDIGGFLGNTSGDLWANWLGFGAFMPFARGHACDGTNNKEPWAYGEAIEKTSKIALERRYRLIPYMYTVFQNTSNTGIPVMAPVFFADPKNQELRAEEQAFLVGEDLLVIPAFANNPKLPRGIWEDLSLVDGDVDDAYQAKLKIKGGSIIPAGKIIQNTGENSFDPLTLMVCLDEKGKAQGKLYIDEGDGWGYQKGDYSLVTFTAEKQGTGVVVKVSAKEGKRNYEKDLNKISATVLIGGRTYTGNGNVKDGIKVTVK